MLTSIWSFCVRFLSVLSFVITLIAADIKARIVSAPTATAFIGAIGFVSLILKILKEEPSWFIAPIIKAYQWLVETISLVCLDWWLPLLFKLIAQLFGWPFELFPQWRDVTILLFLYLIAHIKDAWKLQNRYEATALRACAGLVALVLALAGASVSHVVGWPPIVSIVSAFLIGAVVYRIGFAAQFAFDLRRKKGASFNTHFFEKARGAATILVCGMAVLVSALLVAHIGNPARAPFIHVVFLFILMLVLSLYHIVAAAHQVGRHDSPRARAEIVAGVSNTGHFMIGMRILMAWLAALLFIFAQVTTA